jgi:inosine-uridine nucleoside N-ribohydrolase
MEYNRLKNLTVPSGKIDVVLDTDAYNEVDDQFAISYMLCYQERLNIKGFTAAPFFNQHSSSPSDGMYKSYDELIKLLNFAGENELTKHVYHGSTHYMTDEKTPVDSEAADFLAKLADEYSADKPLYIVAIGAITNVACAILKCPEIVDRAGVIWLGGHGHHLPSYPGKAVEFNLRGDIAAAQIVFDSKIPLLQVPCGGVCSEISTTTPELEHYLRGKGAICDYLVDNVAAITFGKYAKSRVIWDVTTATPLIDPQGCMMAEVPSPIILDDGTYAFASTRHPILYVQQLYRDRIFADLFRSLTGEL